MSMQEQSPLPTASTCECCLISRESLRTLWLENTLLNQNYATMWESESDTKSDLFCFSTVTPLCVKQSLVMSLLSVVKFSCQVDR